MSLFKPAKSVNLKIMFPVVKEVRLKLNMLQQLYIHIYRG